MYFSFHPFTRPMLWGQEQWILSAYPHMESTVKDGLFAGKTLSELIAALGPALLGHDLYERYGNEFPLLIKFIEAKMPLSIQVHPTDALALKQGKGKVGKTEMWYALANEKKGSIYTGLKNRLTPEMYAEHVQSHSIVDDLACYYPKEGDCFFLPAGRIHAIGAGCHLLEIQQSSDVTYRIYDYDRKDANGNLRELHTALAAESIDYTVLPDYQTRYEHKLNAPMPLVQCPYFETTAYEVTDKVAIDWHDQDRFLALIVTKGEGTLTIDGEAVKVQSGDTLLLPATTTKIEAISNKQQTTDKLTFVTATV